MSRAVVERLLRGHDRKAHAQQGFKVLAFFAPCEAQRGPLFFEAELADLAEEFQGKPVSSYLIHEAIRGVMISRIVARAQADL